ncbi:uncharacterized protein LOC144456832 [Phascolarctos cinereus]
MCPRPGPANHRPTLRTRRSKRPPARRRASAEPQRTTRTRDVAAAARAIALSLLQKLSLPPCGGGRRAHADSAHHTEGPPGRKKRAGSSPDPAAALVPPTPEIEGLWQPCIKQVYWHHFFHIMCSYHVSVSHFGNSCNISNFFIIITSVMVICNQ